MSGIADSELVKGTRAGDRDAFGALCERYEGMVQRIARRMVARADLAHDLSQEALLQAYLSLDRLRDDDKFRSWLYGITLNVCRGYLRDRNAAFGDAATLQGGLLVERFELASAEPGPEEVAEARELHRLVMAAIDELSPENRSATLLFYYEGLSLREMASTLGISLAAAKGRLHKSRLQLRRHLLPAVADLGEPVIVSPTPEEPGGTRMIKVTVADIVRSSYFEKNAEADHHIVVLWDEESNRILPIWIGPFEAHALAVALHQGQTPRPLTYTFMANLLKAAGAGLKEVRIHALRNETFYAIAVLIRSDRGTQEVDARPSDALNLALIVACPIYVADEVMANQGISLPEGKTLRPRQGVDRMIEENPMMRAVVQVQQAAASASEEGTREEPKSRTFRELTAYLVGEQG